MTGPEPASAVSDASLAALLCAVDPAGLGGIVLRGRAGPLRDRWLASFRALLHPGVPVRRLPLHADETRIFGGLDLTATLAAGRPVAERGLLAEADGGIVLVSMAERLPAAMAARLGAVLDTGAVRSSAATGSAARIGLVAFDEGIEPDERPPSALSDRLAFLLDIDDADPTDAPGDAAAVARARNALDGVGITDGALEALCATAAALGVGSLRASVLATRAARVAAALAGRRDADLGDAAMAARLVLAPRATRLPAAPEADTSPEPPPQDPSEPQADDEASDTEATPPEAPGDLVLAAARAAIPPGLLARLQGDAIRGTGRQTPGRAGAVRMSVKRGRPIGVRSGTPASGVRLNVIATLRAAAPWQRLRARPATTDAGRRIEIRRDDLRITRFRQHSETVAIFVVDASGSLAVNRLAEAKGAVLTLLADCYVRRDQVALFAFRGKSAELLLPPTRSLARARRCLAALPGGGPTPLASAIDAAAGLAEAVARRGQTPVVVFLTDGRANVSRDGTTGRAEAEADARLAAQAAAASGVRMLVIDAAPRPQPPAQALATALRAQYLAMPRAEADTLSRAVLAVSGR